MLVASSRGATPCASHHSRVSTAVAHRSGRTIPPALGRIARIARAPDDDTSR